MSLRFTVNSSQSFFRARRTKGAAPIMQIFRGFLISGFSVSGFSVSGFSVSGGVLGLGSGSDWSKEGALDLFNLAPFPSDRPGWSEADVRCSGLVTFMTAAGCSFSALSSGTLLIPTTVLGS